MNEKENIEVVRRGYEAFGRGDMAGTLSLFDENIEWMSAGPPKLVTASRSRVHRRPCRSSRVLAVHSASSRPVPSGTPRSSSP